MNSESIKIIRCAIYTRKSSEEGLDQSFNSLDAQREACEAFISSQRQEGWRALPGSYDDGGYSGGTMERPALKQLLHDIEAGTVDTIVVYKVDRLTRSLADFAKIVEALDARGASFVSVTQQFNSTTSMGRLTLNVLLSFAQFEREVTGERIRDKIAASKRKGMWMGGTVPLGYDLQERRLVINEKEANFVRDIYALYLELGSVSQLKLQLDQSNRVSKVRVSATGRNFGGTAYSRGALYQILKNRVYIGEIIHLAKSYPGQHERIIHQETWEQVQTKLKSDNQGRRNGLRINSTSLLTGLLEDSQGNRFTPSHAVNDGKRYRYYKSREKTASSMGAAAYLRLPAGELENQVLARLQTFFQSPEQVLENIHCEQDTVSIRQRLGRATTAFGLQSLVLSSSQARDLARTMIRRVILHREKLELYLSKAALRTVVASAYEEHAINKEHLRAVFGEDDLVCLIIKTKLIRARGETTIIVPSDNLMKPSGSPTASLIKAVAKAHLWREQLLTGEMTDRRSLARQMGVSERYAGRICECAFLAPDIVEAILEGRQPRDLSFSKLTKNIPADWVEQRRLLGFENPL